MSSYLSKSDALKNYLHERHYDQPGPYLWPLSFLGGGYAFAVGMRSLGYALHLLKKQEIPVPVISIGNLTTGGTGKTPIVLAMAQELIRLQKNVVILSRGYGAAEPLDYGQPRGPQHGDEAYYLHQSLPGATIIVGKNRAANAQQAFRQFRPDVVLLDDGYQYIKLKRDYNILLIDGEHLFGNGKMLPAGPLREPVSAIRRADLILITKKIVPENRKKILKWAKRYGKSSLVVKDLPFEGTEFRSLATGDIFNSQVFQGFPVVALSAIAQPDNFEASLLEAGVKIRTHFKFPDHHLYTIQEMMDIVSWRAPEEVIVTTEKDRVKIERLLPEAVRRSVYTLLLRPKLTLEEILPANMMDKLGVPGMLPAHVPSKV